MTTESIDMDILQKHVQNFISSNNIQQLRAQYWRQQQMLVIENFLPRTFIIEHLVPEVKKCMPHIHRVKIPGFKKSGSVSYHHLKNDAEQISQLYKMEIFRKLIEEIVDVRLEYCPERDGHAAALYYYTEPGDRIGVHYDKSFYKGSRFTVLLGLVQDSEQSKLICYPGASKKHPRKNPLPVVTHPGTLVIFNGDVLWHEVTPLGPGEERVILTLEYLTDTRISFLNKWLSDFKDRFLYFGKTQYEKV